MTNTHPNREEDFDLYALGALEGKEKRDLESHVRACESCRRKLAEAHGRISLLAFAAAATESAAATKNRLLEKIRAAAEETPGEAAPQGARPAAAPTRRGLPWWTAILIPAGLAFAVATIFLWRANLRLERELAGLRASVAQEQAELQSAREAAAGHPAGVKEASLEWTGWISDNLCGAKGMSASHKDCALRCVKEMHAYWVFVDSKSKSILKIHNQEEVNPQTSLGAEMKVTGWMMDDGTLEVQNIAANR